MNQRGDRSWALHCIRQPNVEGELCRLPNTTDEHHDQWPLKICTLNGSAQRGISKDHGELKAVIQVIQHEQAHHKEYVTNTRSKECLLGCSGCTRLFPVEANEEVRTETHNLPENE